MADSIPSLRRKLDEANAEIARQRAALENPVRTEFVYVDNPALIDTIQVLQERLAQCQKQ